MSYPKAFNCPSCGAPLSIKGAEREVVCQYCGTHVVVPEEMRSKPPAPVAPQITVQPKVVVVSPYASPISGYHPRRSGCSGLAITFSIIIAVVGFTLAKNTVLQKQLLGALTSGNNVT